MNVELSPSSRSAGPLFARLSCSTICFRHFPLADGLAAIRELGFTHADIGTLPGFCDHFDFVRGSPDEEERFLATIRASGVRVHTFTTNITEPNDPGFSPEVYRMAGLRNIRVAAALGAHGIVLNCGATIDRERGAPRQGWARDRRARAGGGAGGRAADDRGAAQEQTVS
jgi:sugar phosphate isomerase/epimerase